MQNRYNTLTSDRLKSLAAQISYQASTIKNGGKNMAFQFTDANFKKEALESNIPVLVDFYADWCGLCKAMTPVIREVAQSTEGNARVVKIDIDKNQRAAQAYGISGVPTFILFKQGKILWRHSGMIDKKTLLSVITQNA